MWQTTVKNNSKNIFRLCLKCNVRFALKNSVNSHRNACPRMPAFFWTSICRKTWSRYPMTASSFRAKCRIWDLFWRLNFRKKTFKYNNCIACCISYLMFDVYSLQWVVYQTLIVIHVVMWQKHHKVSPVWICNPS